MKLAIRIFVMLGLLASAPPNLAVPFQPEGLATMYVTAFLAGHEFDMPEGELVMATARGVQARFIELLIPERGPVVGYKAGLTNAVAQARFGISQPVRGSLLRDMLTESPARLGLDQGARLAVEADLLVRVGEASLNQAQTDEELMAALDAVIPFVEVPDLMFPEGSHITAELLVAANVGARFGVLGEVIRINKQKGLRQRLCDFEVIITDDSGLVLARGTGQNLLGDPIEVVRWLRDEIVSSGTQIKAGDLLSLGSLTPLLPAKRGQTIRARYHGLDPSQVHEVTVSFRGSEN